MLNANNAVPGSVIRSRAAFALIAATLLAGGSISEASAKSRHSPASRAARRPRAAGSMPMPRSLFRSFSGMASYYGNESGSRTASGQRFNQNAMTCGPPLAAVRHQAQGDPSRPSVIVTVNDRGPFIRGRVLDLSKGAARAIGLTGAGVGHVTAEVCDLVKASERRFSVHQISKHGVANRRGTFRGEKGLPSQMTAGLFC